MLSLPGTAARRRVVDATALFVDDPALEQDLELALSDLVEPGPHDRCPILEGAE
jgi:hypothetical protein